MNDDPLHHDEQLQLADRIAFLIAGHINNSLTPEESDELDDWITASDENLALFEKLTDEDNIEAAMHQMHRHEQGKAKAFQKVQAAIRKERRGLGQRQWLWPALLAASVLAVCALLYFLAFKDKNIPDENQLATTQKPGDIKAGSSKAVLTLSDGRTIILDSAGKGLLANEGAVNISTGTGGEIVYTGSANENRFNTLSTPRGGQFKVALDDGTLVWLNAESSLRFPAGFPSGERLVELKGEAYFEVAKDASKPFKVAILTKAGEEGRVEVLGTHFNVNGYADGGPVTATLLEGLVRVTSDGDSKTLRPGEKAILTEGIKVVKAATREETAWKDGKFLFRDATARSIGEQIKRWYDVEVEYQGDIKKLFNTEAARNVPLSELLDGLEGTGEIHFDLNGKKLVISP